MDLYGQFPGRRDDDGTYFPVLFMPFLLQQPVHNGKQECRGLAGAGLGLAGYIMTLEDDGKGLRLDWRTTGKANGSNRLQQFFVQRKPVKGDSRLFG